MPAFTWASDADDAQREQLMLQDLIVVPTPGTPFKFARGLAIGTAYEENTQRAFAVGVPFLPDGTEDGPVQHADAGVEFPYISGLLAFRVGPAICALMDANREGEFDLLLFDGQGIAHPRGLGLATHIGVLYNIASVGVTRRSLFGRYTDPPPGRFNRTTITHPKRKVTIGYALSLGDTCPPCYVSAGHRVAVDVAVDLVCQISGQRACFPRPLLTAHSKANADARRHWARARPQSVNNKG